MDRGAWQIIVHGDRKESVTTEQLTLTFSSLRKAGRSLAYVQASCRLVVADYLPK